MIVETGMFAILMGLKTVSRRPMYEWAAASPELFYQ